MAAGALDRNDFRSTLGDKPRVLVLHVLGHVGEGTGTARTGAGRRPLLEAPGRGLGLFGPHAGKACGFLGLTLFLFQARGVLLKPISFAARLLAIDLVSPFTKAP